MWNEDKLRAALKAEASLARVPAADILDRIKGARKTTPWYRLRPVRLTGVVAACAVIAALAATPLVPKLLNHTPAPASGTPQSPVITPPAPAVPEREPKIDANGVYANTKLGFRLTFPAGFTGPTSDEQGNLVFKSGPVEVSVGRRDRQSQRQLADLAGDLVADTVRQSTRLNITKAGLTQVAGRKAAVVHVVYISAAAWFERETYAIPSGNGVYTVACGSTPGSQTSWEQAKPICEQVLGTLEVGLDQGYLSRSQAEQAALANVQGDYKVEVSEFNEEWEAPGRGKVPVWLVQLATKGDGQTAWSIILDAKSGAVLYQEDLITGQRTQP